MIFLDIRKYWVKNAASGLLVLGGMNHFPLYIMLQKVAAMVDKVAADLGFRAYEVRWLLPEKYIEIAVSSAACLLCLYIL